MAGLREFAQTWWRFQQRTTKTPEWAPRVQMRQFEPFYTSNKAIVALSRGRPAAAVDVLRAQIPVLRDGPSWLLGPAGTQTFFAATQLAAALAANGDLAEAIATLEQTVSDRVATISSNTPNRWLRANARLASLYRRNGQQEQARTIEAQMAKLLAHADADHPLAVQLKARR
jgi:hypothetical protein